MNGLIGIVQHILSFQNELFKAMQETLLLVSVATLMALLIGLPMGTAIYLTRTGGYRPNKIVNGICNLYVNIMRSFPFIIFTIAMMPVTRFILGYSLGTVPATLPLSCVAIAIFARFVEQALLEVPTEITDTARCLGVNTWQFVTRFLYVEAMPGLVLGLTSSIISFVSYSSVMGIVGGGGIGDFVMRYGFQKFDYVLMNATVGIMILGVMLTQYIGTVIARKLDHS